VAVAQSKSSEYVDEGNHNATMFADCIFSEHQQSAEEGAAKY
jgi:hypothetical protein